MSIKYHDVRHILEDMNVKLRENNFSTTVYMLGSIPLIYEGYLKRDTKDIDIVVEDEEVKSFLKETYGGVDFFESNFYAFTSDFKETSKKIYNSIYFISYENSLLTKLARYNESDKEIIEIMLKCKLINLLTLEKDVMKILYRTNIKYFRQRNELLANLNKFRMDFKKYLEV